jgi:hypothetical protein
MALAAFLRAALLGLLGALVVAALACAALVLAALLVPAFLHGGLLLPAVVGGWRQVRCRETIRYG